MVAQTRGGKMSMTFREKLEKLINECSMENGSDTPDFILAEYLDDCLTAYDKATVRRTKWYMPAGDVPPPDDLDVPEDLPSEA